MMSDDDMHAVMDVNLFSAVTFLRVLTKKHVNHGVLRSVVMVSSINSYRGASGLTAYCASKGAVDGFVRAAAVELAPHVRVNAVRPGTIQTHEDGELTEEARAIFQQPEAHGYLLGNGRPDDIVSMIRYLLSPRARWITGQCFTVDGGWTAH